MSEGEPLPSPAYEPRDAEPRVIAITAASLAAILALGIAVGALARPGDAGRRAAAVPAGPDAFFQHGPDARTGVEESWAEIGRAVQGHLAGYAWIDRQAGTVRIPIDRAIDLVCEEQKPRPPESAARGARP